MTFARLGRGEWIALIAALALLLALPLTWYSTHQAEQDRQFQHQFSPRLNLEETPSPSTQAAEAAKALEKNAWQASSPIDRLLLFAMLASAALAIAAAFTRAADRAFGRVRLSALATVAATAAAALIIYRIAQPPGGIGAVTKPGAYLGLLALLGTAFGSRLASFPANRSRRVESAPAPTPDVLA